MGALICKIEFLGVDLFEGGLFGDGGYSSIFGIARKVLEIRISRTKRI